jgi:alpha-beta hydrolase superfamily lysophospholipase
MEKIDFNLKSKDGTRLHLHTWQTADPQKVIVIVHGMGGHADFYTDSLVQYIEGRNISVYAADLRGHGRSEGVRGDIENFDDYLEDVKAAVKFARERHPDLPLFLLGESMGTPIAVNYAATAQGIFRPDALMLLACVVAPTITPRLSEIFRFAFYSLYDRKKIVIPITGREHEGISDVDFIKVLKADPLFNRKVSVRFLMKVTKYTGKAFKSAAKLTMPTVVMVGERDITVRFKATRKFFDQIAATDKEWHLFPNVFHSILNDLRSAEVRARLFVWLDRVSLSLPQTLPEAKASV